LKQGLFKEGLTNIALDAAAEHMIDSHFEGLLEIRGIMPLRSDHLLIEMSYLQESLNFDEAVQKITTAGFFPILAHPERYRYLHHKKSKYRDYKQKGVLLQLNLLSLSDYYGKDIQKMAVYLLEHNLIDFIASDIHNKTQLNALKEIKVSRSIADKVLPVIRNTISGFY
jgi:tyrosine-protein phosphatase YwqE